MCQFKFLDHKYTFKSRWVQSSRSVRWETIYAIHRSESLYIYTDVADGRWTLNTYRKCWSIHKQKADFRNMLITMDFDLIADIPSTRSWLLERWCWRWLKIYTNKLLIRLAEQLVGCWGGISLTVCCPRLASGIDSSVQCTLHVHQL